MSIAKVFSFAEATVVLPFDFAKIIWGAAIGTLFFAEVVDAWTWVGAIVIFAAAMYLAARERQLEQARRTDRTQ